MFSNLLLARQIDKENTLFDVQQGRREARSGEDTLRAWMSTLQPLETNPANLPYKTLQHILPIFSSKNCFFLVNQPAVADPRDQSG